MKTTLKNPLIFGLALTTLMGTLQAQEKSEPRLPGAIATEFKKSESTLLNDLEKVKTEKKVDAADLDKKLTAVKGLESEFAAATQKLTATVDDARKSLTEIEARIAHAESLKPDAANFELVNTSMQSISNVFFTSGVKDIVALINSSFKVSFKNSRGEVILANYSAEDKEANAEKSAVLRALTLAWMNNSSMVLANQLYVSKDKRVFKTKRLIGKDDHTATRLSDEEVSRLSSLANTLILNANIQVEARTGLASMDSIASKISQKASSINIQVDDSQQLGVLLADLQSDTFVAHTKPTAEDISKLKENLDLSRKAFVSMSTRLQGVLSAGTDITNRVIALEGAVKTAKKSVATKALPKKSALDELTAN